MHSSSFVDIFSKNGRTYSITIITVFVIAFLDNSTPSTNFKKA